MDIVPADQARLWNGREWRGVRTLRHTYARFQDGGWLLYEDVEATFQKSNLIDDSAFEKVREGLEAKLRAWLRKLGDAFLLGEQHLEQLGLLDAWKARERHFHGGGNW